MTNIQVQEYLCKCKPKRLNDFGFVLDSAIALKYFVCLFEFSLSVFQLFPICEFENFLTSVYRVTVNNFKMGGGNFIGHL